MVGQHKTHSVLEAVANVVVGFGINLLGQIIIFPLVGVHASFLDNLHIAFWFTLLSLARTYFIRRYFNRVMLAFHRKNGSK